MDKLIITNCAADTNMYAEVPGRFHDSGVLAESIHAAWRAGASIAHIHAPNEDFQAWASHTKAIRERCDVLIVRHLHAERRAAAGSHRESA